MQMQPLVMGNTSLVFTDRNDGTETDAPESGFNLGNASALLPEKLNLLADATGLTILVLLNQVHGNDVLVIDEDSLIENSVRILAEELAMPRELPTADAAVTALRGVGLVIRVADCLPVLLVDDSTGVIGAAHAGRVGLLAGVLTNTVEKMRELGAIEISAFVGPHICGNCYEVPATMQEEAATVPGIVSRTSWGTPALDLGAAAAAELVALGVLVTRLDPCTFEDENYYSHRGDNGKAGRQVGLIWRK